MEGIGARRARRPPLEGTPVTTPASTPPRPTEPGDRTRRLRVVAATPISEELIARVVEL